MPREKPSLRITRVDCYTNLVIYLLGLLATLYYFAGSSLIHLSLHSNAWDLGVFEQVIWNSAHGRFFEYSFRPYLYLGDHFSPILLLLSPLGWVESALPLLLVQAAALGAGSVVLYFLAKRFISSGVLVYLIVVSFIFNPFVLQAVNFDFHPDVFLPLLGFLVVYFLVKGQGRPAGLCFLLFLSVREDAFLAFLPVLYVVLITLGRKREAVFMTGVGLLYFLVVNAFIMPSLRGLYSAPITEHYGYLGSGFRRILLTILTNPLVVVVKLTGSSELFGLFKFLLGSGFLILLAPGILLLSAPTLLIRLMSAEPWSYQLLLHYGIQLVLPVYLGLVLAVDWLEKKLSKAGQKVLTVYLVFVVLINFAVFSPWPPSVMAGLDLTRFTVTAHDRKLWDIQKIIPNGAAVSAQTGLLPHFAFRQKIYEFPRTDDARYVILDNKGIISGQSLAAGFYEAKDSLPKLGFKLISFEDGFEVYER